MERNPLDGLDGTDMKRKENSALKPVSKRRRLLLEDDFCAESGSDQPSDSGLHEFRDIAEVYGGQFDGLVEIGDDDDDDDVGNRKASSFCAICDDGGHLLICDGPCMRSFHASTGEPRCRSLGLKVEDYMEVDSWYCLNCKHGQQQCFNCGLLGRSEGENKEVFVCDVALCGRFYHPNCLGEWKEKEGTIEDSSDFIRSVKEGNGFCCPAHNCRRCGKGDEESADNLMKLAKCRRCPKAFHKMCLPTTISFERQGHKPIRAWEVGTKLVMYCLRHDIIESLKTPSRNHLKWPVVPSLKQKDATSSGTGLKRNFQKMTLAASLKQKDKSFLKVPVLKQNCNTRPEAFSVKQNHPLRNAKIPVNLHHGQKDTAMRDKATPAFSGPVVVRSFGLLKGMEPIRKIEVVHPPAKKNLKEGQRSRISRLLQQAAFQVTLEDMKKTLVKPSCYQENKDKNLGHRGWIESTLNAAKKALNLLKNGGSIEDGKRLCTKESLRQLLRTEKSLEVYLAPLLHGPRYTSFGRHFTRVDKLEQIVDRIHPYIDNGDMVVDFCCGANDFSVLLNKKLKSRGKFCEFRNFDLHPPKDTFCFTQGDWFENDGHDFLEGSRLIVGLNPPFGYKASLAEKFILHALKFKPKLLILIVPPETMSYTSRYKEFDYDLVWFDDDLLSGKAFFIPGSVDGSTNDQEHENMLQWNKVTPPLFVVSRGDMTRRHKEIAVRCEHMRASHGDVPGTQGRVPPPPPPPPPPLWFPPIPSPHPRAGKCQPTVPPPIPGRIAIPVPLSRAPSPGFRAMPLSSGEGDSSSAASPLLGWPAFSSSGERPLQLQPPCFDRLIERPFDEDVRADLRRAIPVPLSLAPSPGFRAMPLSSGERDSSSAASPLLGWPAFSSSGERPLQFQPPCFDRLIERPFNEDGRADLRRPQTSQPHLSWGSGGGWIE